MTIQTSAIGGIFRRFAITVGALTAAFALVLSVPAAAQEPAPIPIPGAEAPGGDAIPLPAEPPPAVDEAIADEVDPDAVVATVNGAPITERDLAVTAQIMGNQLTQFPEENWRAILIQVAIEFRLIAAAAEAEALDDDAEFLAQLALIRERLLRDSYVEQFVVPTVTEEDINAAYEAAVAGMNLPTEVQIRHIMVTTEAEANEVLLQLAAGADFAQLALERSLDRVTAETGGLIDVYWAPGELVQEFDDVVFSVPAGEVLPFPVAFDGNWHVIRVDQSRLRSPPAYEELRDTLQQQLVTQAYTDAVAALEAAADIVVIGAEPAGEPAPGDVAPPAEPPPAVPPPAEAPAPEPAPAPAPGGG
jgi:peptidyl-prolyl cis-trans isomerase C